MNAGTKQHYKTKEERKSRKVGGASTKGKPHSYSYFDDLRLIELGIYVLTWDLLKFANTLELYIYCLKDTLSDTLLMLFVVLVMVVQQCLSIPLKELD